MFRRRAKLEVLLVHPGGPFWARKDAGAWSLPKGEYTDSERPLHAAQREFREETGFAAKGPFLELGSIQQKSGKVVTAWAAEGDVDASRIQSNTFTMEWPPRSGRQQTFPEVDRAAWFTLDEAAVKINTAQKTFLDRLEDRLR